MMLGEDTAGDAGPAVGPHIVLSSADEILTVVKLDHEWHFDISDRRPDEFGVFDSKSITISHEQLFLLRNFITNQP